MAVARHVRGWAVACSAKISALVALVRLWIHRLYRLPLADAVPDPFLHVPRRCRRLRLHKNIVPRKMTLILDLDETLVHSSVKPMANYDWRVSVPASGEQRGHTFFVAVRPHAAMFLRAVSKWYEVVVFTASLQHYADPVIDLIDTDQRVSRRFFRSACKLQDGNFLKDISAVRQDLSQVVIVDNSPVAYSLQEDNAIPISTWIDDPRDDALASLLPLLQGLVLLNDVRSILGLRASTALAHRVKYGAKEGAVEKETRHAIFGRQFCDRQFCDRHFAAPCCLRGPMTRSRQPSARDRAERTVSRIA